jgi:hypothetical protein
MRLFPTEAVMNSLKSLDDVDFYKDAVDALKAMDTIDAGAPILLPDGTIVTDNEVNLIAEDAQENVLLFEISMLNGLLIANKAIVSHPAAKQALPVVKNLIARTQLGLYRDAQIIAVLQSYIDHKFEGEEALTRLLESIQGVLKNAALGRAIDLLKTGDWTKFFGMNPATATYIGAGLAAIAALKACFDEDGSVEEQERLTKFQRKFEQEKDLLNIKVSFDLDLQFLRSSTLNRFIAK